MARTVDLIFDLLQTTLFAYSTSQKLALLFFSTATVNDGLDLPLER
jgi:hypothetical protein